MTQDYVALQDFVATNAELIVQAQGPNSKVAPNNLILNNQDPILKDVRARSALNMALDRKSIIDTDAEGGRHSLAYGELELVGPHRSFRAE